MSRGQPQGPSDWPVWLVAILVFGLVVVFVLLVTGRLQP